MKFTNHPEFDKKLTYWEDCFNLIAEGDTKTVKSLNEVYLPKLESHIREGGYQGETDYAVFKSDAIWHDIPRTSLDDILGLMFEKSSTYNLPVILESYREKITVEGNSLEVLEFMLQAGQLTYGRQGIIISPVNDVKGVKLPVISYYDPQCIVNWHTFIDDEGNIKYDYVLLKISDYYFNPKTYEYESTIYYIVHALNKAGNYFKVKLRDTELSNFDYNFEKHETYVEPVFKGKKLKYVPFVALNATNVDGKLDVPPLYEMSMLSVQAYKSSALYQRKNRQQTWALLVLAGFDFENEINKALKSDGYIKSKNPNAKAEYVSPDSSNMESMKENLDRLIYEAETRGVYISQKNVAEASKSLEMRRANQSNAYRLMANFRNEAIVKALKIICNWGGITYDTKQPLIVPYDEFNVVNFTYEDAIKIATLVDSGKLPEEDMYKLYKKNGLTSFENYVNFKANLKNTIFEE